MNIITLALYPKEGTLNEALKTSFWISVSFLLNSGLIGRSWAMLFACGGYRVALYDTDSAQLKSALSEIESQLRHLSEKGLSRGTLADEEQISRISDCSSLKDAVCGAAYIQECVPELKELKREVLQAVSELMEPTAVLASSTSAMMPSLLSDHLYCRGRFTVAHPGNPPFYIPVVEIVPAPWTEADVTAKCCDIMADIGQVPVVFLKERDGFAFGRIQFAVQAAAYELIKNGYCDVDAVETGMTEGLGMWYAFYGLFQVEHMNADGFVDLCKKYGDAIYGIQTSFEPPEVMVGETARKMLADLEEFCPLDQLQAKRKWRDDRLAALARLIKELEDNVIQNTEA